ncbi:MAG: hypothetical protein IJL90_02075 [Lachnospiraceae bacterium]|nr:hypothetical protein [Lachnospiraceae bacterium]
MDITAFDPKEKIKLSCNVLKTLACVFMFIDHCGYGILHNYMIAHAMDIMPEEYKTLNSLYETCRGIGRLAFPIFCFFLVEGFLRTRAVVKYAFRLLILAVISEIPFDLGLYGKAFNWDHQNIILTFLLALIMMTVLKYMTQTFIGMSKQLLCLCHVCTVIAFADLAYLLKADYSWKCILLVAVLYYLKDLGTLRLLAGSATVSWKAFAPISFVLLYFYDPSMKPRYKYAFYLFYPVNFIIVYLLARVII